MYLKPGPATAMAERRWIAQIKSEGADLLNGTDGGDGRPGIAHSEETRARISRANRGRKLSQEQLLRIRAYRPTAETRAKLSAARKKRVTTAETREKMSQSNKGRKHTAEARANMSNAQRGRVLSEEARANIKAAALERTDDRKWSPERHANYISPLKGKQYSEEIKARMKAAARRRQETNPSTMPPQCIAAATAAKLGKALPEERKRQLSQKLKGRKLPQEHVANIKAALQGRIFTPEHRAALEVANADPERKRKISETMKKYKATPEHRAALKAAWVRRRAAKTNATNS